VTRNLERQTIEVDSWVTRFLHEGGIDLYPVEGYSVRGNRVTALFERRASDTELMGWTNDEIKGWLHANEDKESWRARYALSSCLGVPLYLVLWMEDKEAFRKFRMVVSSPYGIMLADEEVFDSCRSFARWLAKLKDIQVTKAFIEPGRMSSIDVCLRENDVPWPGNLDGFYPSPTEKSVKAIFEFSRTKKYPVETHDVNNYFRQDINRWRPPGILKEQLDASLYVVIWSSSERLIKVSEVSSVGSTSLAYASTELLTEEKIIPCFRRILA